MKKIFVLTSLLCGLLFPFGVSAQNNHDDLVSAKQKILEIKDLDITEEEKEVQIQAVKDELQGAVGTPRPSIKPTPSPTPTPTPIIDNSILEKIQKPTPTPEPVVVEKEDVGVVKTVVNFFVNIFDSLFN